MRNKPIPILPINQISSNVETYVSNDERPGGVHAVNPTSSPFSSFAVYSSPDTRARGLKVPTAIDKARSGRPDIIGMKSGANLLVSMSIACEQHMKADVPSLHRSMKSCAAASIVLSTRLWSEFVASVKRSWDYPPSGFLSNWSTMFAGGAMFGTDTVPAVACCEGLMLQGVLSEPGLCSRYASALAKMVIRSSQLSQLDNGLQPQYRPGLLQVAGSLRRSCETKLQLTQIPPPKYPIMTNPKVYHSSCGWMT